MSQHPSRRRHSMAAAALALSLAACSTTPRYEAPVPTDAPRQTQLKLQALKHWELVSQDHARTLVDSLRGAGLATTPVAVVAESAPSSFGEAYHELLLTRLVEAGLHVVRGAPAPLEISYRTQLIGFEPGRDNQLDTFYPFLYSGLGAAVGIGGVAAITKASVIDKRDRLVRDTLKSAARKAGVAVIGTAFLSGLATDFWRIEHRETTEELDRLIPSHELLLSTTVSQGPRLIGRRSDAYYLRDVDATLYAKLLPTPLPPTRTVPVLAR